MYAITGSLLTAGGLVAVMLLALLFRHPGAPRWTRTELAASLLVVVVTGVLGVGLGYLALVPHQFLSQGTSLADLTAMAGSLAGLLVAWRALRGRLRAPEAAASIPAPGAKVTVLASGAALSTDQPTPPRTPRPQPGRPPRKAA